MFNENLKTIRKSKGFTQEELAIKINVVRQTVSKWEKGLSVPDADALQRIAEVLDVGVEELLGAQVQTDADKNEIAEQLSRINEQLVIKNRRWSRFWKIVGIILLGSVILNVLGVFLYGFNTESMSPSTEVEESVIDEGYEEMEE
ncbi:MAG: helix-turn-helix transcriptional regulator [Lachnospiraceae bacterium]|nr:helix-turn-helix transcriptional regulator [Lachnospiraceae bacterium]